VCARESGLGSAGWCMTRAGWGGYGRVCTADSDAERILLVRVKEFESAGDTGVSIIEQKHGQSSSFFYIPFDQPSPCPASSSDSESIAVGTKSPLAT